MVYFILFYTVLLYIIILDDASNGAQVHHSAPIYYTACTCRVQWCRFNMAVFSKRR